MTEPMTKERRILIERLARQYNGTAMLELLAEINQILACLSDIAILAADYDGHETPDKLKGLIDEMADLARSRKPLPAHTNPPKSNNCKSSE